MKILVLTNDLMERTVIQQVLQYNKHEVVLAGDSETAMQLLREGEIRFVIADRVSTDLDEKQFLQRLRQAQPPYYIYVLLIASRVTDADVTTPQAHADDYLHKPIVPLELKSRVHIGERILGLGDHLAVAKDTVERLAMFDPLTKLLNENAFLNLARGELERARRNQAPFSLVALNIDNFNEIKAAHGEAIANDVLILVSQALREKSRPYDGTGRYEAATFLIPLAGVIGQDAEKIGERILKGVRNANITKLDGTALNVNVSVGVATAVRITVNTEVDLLLTKVKELLAIVKRNGSNQIETAYL